MTTCRRAGRIRARFTTREAPSWCCRNLETDAGVTLEPSNEGRAAAGRPAIEAGRKEV